MVQTNGAVAERAHSEPTRGNHFVPAVDIFETDNELFLYADLPGVGAEDVELHFEKGELILRGRLPARSQPANYLLQEYQEADFYRVFRVDESIRSTGIEAECKNGVLTVRLPKEEKVKPRQVKVKGA